MALEKKRRRGGGFKSLRGAPAQKLSLVLVRHGGVDDGHLDAERGSALAGLQADDSAFLLSLVGALQFTPVLLFSLFAGVLIDRFKKKSILFITQISSFVITLTVAFLVATGRVAYWHLLVSSTLTGFVNTFDAPARQAFVIELVRREDLTNGIALNSAQFNLARILGPALAGVIMAGWNISACFFINAISFGAMIVSLFFINPCR
jgi:MFS family permease